MSRLARALARRGYAVLRFDFTGLGESGGVFSATTVTTQVGDLTLVLIPQAEGGTSPEASLVAKSRRFSRVSSRRVISRRRSACLSSA